MDIEKCMPTNQKSQSQSSSRLSRVFFTVTALIIFAVCCTQNIKSKQLSLTRYIEEDTTRRLQADDDDEEDDESDLKIGVAELLPVGEFTDKIKAKFDIAVKFVGVHELDYDYHVKSLLDDDYEVVVVAEFFSNTSDTNLVDIINGDYDAYLLKFIADWRRDGNREIIIRPLHEMNSNWYEWGTFHGGTNTVENFIEAFIHIHTVFKRARANFKMQLAYNCENPNNDPTPFSNWYPGDEYVDMILCSAYNRYGTNQWHTKWESFYEVFAEGYEKMAALSEDMPLGVGETSSVDEGGDKVEWIVEAFESLQKDFPRVKEADFFFINKEGEDEGDWGLNNNKEMYAFGNEINKMKGITSAPTSAPTMSPTMAPSTATERI